jgi:hypothetical protein
VYYGAGKYCGSLASELDQCDEFGYGENDFFNGEQSGFFAHSHLRFADYDADRYGEPYADERFYGIEQ